MKTERILIDNLSMKADALYMNFVASNGNSFSRYFNMYPVENDMMYLIADVDVEPLRSEPHFFVGKVSTGI